MNPRPWWSAAFAQARDSEERSAEKEGEGGGFGDAVQAGVDVVELDSGTFVESSLDEGHAVEVGEAGGEREVLQIGVGTEENAERIGDGATTMQDSDEIDIKSGFRCPLAGSPLGKINGIKAEG